MNKRTSNVWRLAADGQLILRRAQALKMLSERRRPAVAHHEIANPDFSRDALAESLPFRSLTTKKDQPCQATDLSGGFLPEFAEFRKFPNKFNIVWRWKQSAANRSLVEFPCYRTFNREISKFWLARWLPDDLEARRNLRFDAANSLRAELGNVLQAIRV